MVFPCYRISDLLSSADLMPDGTSKLKTSYTKSDELKFASCCSRNLRRVYFLVLVTLLSYWLLSAVQNAGSGGLEILLIFVV